MNKRFCPKCGATDKPLVKGFCLDCFLKDNPDLVKVEPVFELEQCKKCGKVRIKGQWIEPTSKHLVEFVRSKVKVKELKEVKVGVELIILSETETRADILVKGVINSSLITVEKEALLKFKKALCDPCMRISSQYHEAILQVRGEKETPKSRFEKAFRDVNRLLAAEYRKDPLARIVEVQDHKYGFDVLIGSKRAGRVVAEALAKDFKGRVKVSSKLRGVDKRGKKKYRFTFAVRIS